MGDCRYPEHHTSSSGGGGFGWLLGVAAVVVVAAVWSMIVHILIIAGVIVGGLGVLGVTGYATGLVMRERARATSRVPFTQLPPPHRATVELEGTPVHRGALGGAQKQVEAAPSQHIHFHGLTTADVAEVVAQLRNREGKL